MTTAICKAVIRGTGFPLLTLAVVATLVFIVLPLAPHSGAAEASFPAAGQQPETAGLTHTAPVSGALFPMPAQLVVWLSSPGTSPMLLLGCGLLGLGTLLRLRCPAGDQLSKRAK